MPTNAIENETDSLAAIWDNDELIDYLAREAVQDALQEHKRKGESISIWRDGKVVTLTANEIPERVIGVAPAGLPEIYRKTNP